uniref:Uncharacterized protein n=1 Tax=Anguilla anguilla TaxID=7936 RepID=A0A0E9XRN3_ANGAN
MLYVLHTCFFAKKLLLRDLSCLKHYKPRLHVKTVKKPSPRT